MKGKKKIHTLVKHFVQTCLEHSSHFMPRLKNPNFDFIHRKQIFPFSTSSFIVPSNGNAKKKETEKILEIENLRISKGFEQ